MRCLHKPIICKAKKKNCLVSGNPTDPTFLGPTLNFFETSENLFSIFRLIFNDFHGFPIQKIISKKKICLPTNP